MRRQPGEAQSDAVRSQEDLAHMRQSVDGILTNVGTAPGELLKNEVRILEARVRDDTALYLEGLLERFRAAARGDTPFDDSPERGLVLRR